MNNNKSHSTAYAHWTGFYGALVYLAPYLRVDGRMAPANCEDTCIDATDLQLIQTSFENCFLMVKKW